MFDYQGPRMSWYDPPEPYCDCQECSWCHEAYEHHWSDGLDCEYCDMDYETSLRQSGVSSECEDHGGNGCKICAALESRKIDEVVEQQIDQWKEDKCESGGAK